MKLSAFEHRQRHRHTEVPTHLPPGQPASALPWSLLIQRMDAEALDAAIQRVAKQYRMAPTVLRRRAERYDLTLSDAAQYNIIPSHRKSH